ncbi:hypothetical protein EJB05_01030 [Eragrostis curvula]|uniref:Uncharacterized protein n=1 Tax=Eragrostis curvula TaxID=38414 RepID=A0A5J9WQY1_9POAL|nr:hypothetical protein EJB05_01030 [Eragrostis curvula]
MAATMAKVLKGGLAPASSHSRRLLPEINSHQGLSGATGKGRLMHTGLFGIRGARCQEQLKSLEQFKGKRFMSSDEMPEVRPHPSFVAVGMASVFGFIMMGIYTLPGTIQTIKSFMK